jgi:hypothetical protein
MKGCQSEQKRTPRFGMTPASSRQRKACAAPASGKAAERVPLGYRLHDFIDIA